MIRIIEDEFGDMRLPAVSDPEVLKVFTGWHDKLAAAGKAREADNRLSILARILSYGLDRRLITDNRLAHWERAYRADRADKVWTPEHVERFAARAEPGMLLAFYLALYTGQRQGDLLRLAWTNYKDGHLAFRQSKSGKHVVIRCVAPLAARLDALRREAGEVPSTCILTASRGRPWKSRHFQKTFRETCDAAGIVGLNFHDLRGTAVVMLAEAGCTEAEIASITGHTLQSAGSILRRYWTPTRSQATAAVTKLENYLGTQIANRLQTVASSGGVPGEGDG